MTYQKLGAPVIAEALLRQLRANDVLLAECLVAQTDSAERVAEAIRLCRDLLAVTELAADRERLNFALAKYVGRLILMTVVHTAN